jgi:hypothetical protein
MKNHGDTETPKLSSEPTARDIAARVQHALNNHIATMDAVENDIIADWITPQATAEIIARSPEPRPIREEVKTVRD